MSDTNTLVTFIIVSFALAAVLIFKKETIPDRLRRPLAIFTLFMVTAAFIMLVVSLFQMG